MEGRKEKKKSNKLFYQYIIVKMRQILLSSTKLTIKKKPELIAAREPRKKHTKFLNFFHSERTDENSKQKLRKKRTN